MDDSFGVNVECARRLVQNKDVRTTSERTGDTYALNLPDRQIAKGRTDEGVIHQNAGLIQQRVEDTQSLLGDGVVGRLLMRTERDRLGKRARHRVAVRAHVADLAQREPQARRGREAQREEEHPGKSVAHAMRE